MRALLVSAFAVCVVPATVTAESFCEPGVDRLLARAGKFDDFLRSGRNIVRSEVNAPVLKLDCLTAQGKDRAAEPVTCPDGAANIQIVWEPDGTVTPACVPGSYVAPKKIQEPVEETPSDDSLVPTQ